MLELVIIRHRAGALSSVREAAMSLRRQAKTFTKTQSEAILAYLAKTRHPDRNRVIFLLSVKAGLRAKEIASLTWEMIADADGSIGRAIHLPNAASKGSSGRIIPINGDLREALGQWRQASGGNRPSRFVISTERALRTSP